MGRIRRINDVWEAIGAAGGVVSTYLFVCFFVFIFMAKFFGEFYGLIIFFGLFVFTSVKIYPFVRKVYDVHKEGVVVNSIDNKISFPASDVENSIMDIITFKSFRELQNRASFRLSDIEGLNNETNRWTTRNSEGETIRHVRYLLNISGLFGSQQLSFDSKQKRDECRSSIRAGLREVGGRLGSSDVDVG